MNYNSVAYYFSYVYFLFTCISYSACQNSRQRQNHQIEWNSSNAIFRSNQSFVLNVRLGDTIDFFCPHHNHSTSSDEYNTLYLVSKADYYSCRTKNYQPLVKCDQPHSSTRLIYTLSVSKYLPYPNMPEFLDGNSYYFMSTSNGLKAGIDQKIDGLCRTKNFRFIMNVQKYYKRYSVTPNRMKIQRQLSNNTNEQYQSWMTSSSRKLSSSFVVLLLLCNLLRVYS